MNQEKTFTLTGMQKVVGLILAIAIPMLTSVTSYVVFKASTDYRLVDDGKKLEQHESRITTMEQLGHPDHERRILKLETRADNTDRIISEINSKLDVAVAILQRIETQQQVQNAKKP